TTGGSYNRNLDSWVATADATQERFGHTAVWTGSEMIVWGGGFSGFNTGGRYNPSTDTWADTTAVNAPTGRYDHTAVWAGSEMIVWGGGVDVADNRNILRRGNPYGESTTRTRPTSPPYAPAPHTAHWTDRHVRERSGW